MTSTTTTNTNSRPLVFTNSNDPSSYSLLSLPPALLSLLSSNTTNTLEIRGDTTDAAVLVTTNKTYSIRGQQNSNSLCLCLQSNDETNNTLSIQTVLHETLQLQEQVARTDKLQSLLAPSHYYSGSDAELSFSLPPSIQLQTPTSIQSLLPASNAEITSALRLHRVITLEGYLRPLSPQYLLTILPALLGTCLPLLPLAPTDRDEEEEKSGGGANLKNQKSKPSPPPSSTTLILARTSDLLAALDAVDCSSSDVARQVLAWFGRPIPIEEGEGKGEEEEKWELRIGDIVREVAVGILEEGGYEPQKLAPFLARWHSLCGGFGSLCQLSLLSNTSLLSPPLSPTPSTIQYLPLSSLSPVPADRFAHLFALRPRWRDRDMMPFLEDLTDEGGGGGGGRKKLEALVLKFVRKVKVPGQGWVEWTSRNQF